MYICDDEQNGINLSGSNNKMRNHLKVEGAKAQVRLDCISVYAPKESTRRYSGQHLPLTPEYHDSFLRHQISGAILWHKTRVRQNTEWGEHTADHPTGKISLMLLSVDQASSCLPELSNNTSLGSLWIAAALRTE